MAAGFPDGPEWTRRAWTGPPATLASGAAADSVGPMRPPPTLEQLAQSALRSGWPIAVLCGIALPFSLTAPAALACSAIGLLAGIVEIRRGGALLRSARPGADLRALGWAHTAFTVALAIYFGQKATVLLLGGNRGLGVDPETAALLQSEMPELLELGRSLTLLSTVCVAVVAVPWQAWWSRRYFRAAVRIGDARHVAPIVFQPSAEERAALEQMARDRGMSEEELLRQALRTFAEAQPTRAAPPVLRNG